MQSIPDNWRFVVLEREILEMGLSAKERTLYAQLLLHSLDRKRVVLINYSQLMDECEIKSRTTLAKVIKQLEGRHLIKVERSKAKGTKTAVNKYTVLPLSSTENGLLTESSSTESGLLITQEMEASSPFFDHKKRVNKYTSDPETRSQDHTLTSVEANASVNGQSSLLGGITTQSTGKQSKMARSLSKIDLAQKTGDWVQIKDQDLFLWFVSEHNKRYTRPLVPNPTNAWEVKLFRDNFLAVYDIPRNAEGLEIIRKFIDKYKMVADPKYRDQISFSVFGISGLCDEIMTKATKLGYLEQQAKLRETEEYADEVF